MGSSSEGGSPPQVPLPPSGGNKVVADPNGTYEGGRGIRRKTGLAFSKHPLTLPPQSLSFLFVSAWGIPLTLETWTLHFEEGK